MSEWTFDDGTTLRSGGIVSGTARAAERLRSLIAAHPPARLRVYPHPIQQTAPLDPHSDFLLAALARQVSDELGERVVSEYEPTADDAPPKLRDELRSLQRAAQQAAYGTVY